MGEPDEAVVTFHPQIWVNERAMSGDEPRATFSIPVEDAMIEGELVADNSRESDTLKDHENAPTWVQEWPGPFYVTVNHE